MTPNLPPDRDLPPARHDEIRAELIRTVTSRAAKPMARWLVPAAAAAAVIAVTSGAVAFSQHNSGNDRSDKIAPAAPRPFPVIPGLSKQQSLDIAYGCAKSFGVKGKDLPPRTLTELERPPRTKSPHPDPSETWSGSGSDLRLYNIVTDAAGTRALIIGSKLMLFCTVDPSNRFMPYNAGGGGGFGLRDWLPGEFSMDGGGGPGSPDGPGLPVVADASGRVSSKVAKVTATFGDVTVSTKPINGTYMLRRLYPADWQDPNLKLPLGSPELPIDEPVVRAYDTNGKLLGVRDSEVPEPCYVTPDGEILDKWAHKDTDVKDCKVANPWR